MQCSGNAMAWKDGYRSGYTEYRYGQAKKPTLKRVLMGEKREHVVSRAMDLMKDWRSSPFENEGATRHGLRSALCEDGHAWSVADHEAEVVVAQVFRLMGAKRPSWDQGQRQYTVAEENCNWCGLEIAEEDRSGNRAARFCSAVCARSALQHRDWETRWKEDAVGRSAFAILHREKTPTRECEECGETFRQFNHLTKEQRFCSTDCARRAERTIPECECPTCHVTFRPKVSGRRFCSYECAMVRPIEPRQCTCCEGMFTPKNEQGTVCSKSCQMRLHRIRKAEARGMVYRPLGTVFDGTCRHCHQPFMARSPKAIFCGPKCNSAANYAKRRRQDNVIYLTAEIFDGWFKQAA